ncbi:MAG: TraB/GumN family protein [Gammaproteobacteria bacterium]|nr:TraB/GumN family protein [Gammaproteobacteria bacterium]
MKVKIYLAVAIVIMLAVTTWASAKETDLYQEGLFWKIEKDGEYVGHIFGTLHMNDGRIAKLHHKVNKVLDESKSFAMEAFPSDHYWNPYQGGQLIKHDMVLPKGESLEDFVGEETFKKIQTVLVDTLGMQPELVKTLRPWAAMRSFAIRAESNEVILDYALLERAAEQRKELFQVESIEEFIVTLQEMPIEAQVALLKFTVASYDNMRGIINDMLDAYLEEDLKAMYEISTRFIPDEPENEQWRQIYLKHVVEIRNIVMEHYMRKPMRLRDTFIAVGALHLYGEKGVLALMEKDGYTVTRVDI